MSDEKQRENGAEMEETQEKEPLQEEVEKKSKSPENSQDFQNSDSETEEDQDLPFPGFTAKSLCMTQDHKLRFWCLTILTNPYPFTKKDVLYVSIFSYT